MQDYVAFTYLNGLDLCYFCIMLSILYIRKTIPQKKGQNVYSHPLPPKKENEKVKLQWYEGRFTNSNVALALALLPLKGRGG